MDALLMCGGRGTRLDAQEEKPMYPIAGRPMVDWVRDALETSRIETTYAVVSPHTPQTRSHVREMPVIETPGEGYVSDLQMTLTRIDQPVMTVAGDLPLLDGDAIDDVLEAHDVGSLTVCVKAALKRQLGLDIDETMEHAGQNLAPTGVNVVTNGPDSIHTTFDVRFAVNVNRLTEADVAEALR